MGIVSEPTKFERIHQLLRYTLSSYSVAMCVWSSSANVCVVLVRQCVHLANHFFSATPFYHGLSESCITNEPIVNAQEFSFLTFFGADSKCDILDPLLSFRIGDHVVDLSRCRT